MGRFTDMGCEELEDKPKKKPMKDKKKTKRKLKPYGAVVQQCPDCGKLDVSLNDNHTCDREYWSEREENTQYYD